MTEQDDKAQQAAEAISNLVQERDAYRRLYLGERITGLGAQIALGQELKRQAEAELGELGK